MAPSSPPDGTESGLTSSASVSPTAKRGWVSEAVRRILDGKVIRRT